MAMHITQACLTCVRLNPPMPMLLKKRQFCRRWSRKPIKILTPEECAQQSNPKQRRKVQKEDIVRDEKIVQESTIKTVDKFENLVPSYEKLRKPDNDFLKIMNEVKNSKFRHKHGKILVEGRRHIIDAISSGATPLIIYFTLSDALSKIPKLDKFPDLKIYKLLLRDMKLWSDLTTPGIMGIFEMPDYEELSHFRTKYLPINLIIDNVRQPDNLGAIIRTAAAAGCNKVILMKGCVDLWNPKVLRGSCGAHFRIPIISDINWEKIENYCSPDSQVIIGSNINIETNTNTTKVNEIRLAIQHDLEENEKNVTMYETSEDGTKYFIDENYSEKEYMERYKSLGMESTPYNEIKIDPKKEVNIVIGGESEGLSGEAFRFSYKHFGHCANIPMGNNIESLNSAVASGILLFHVKNVFLKNNADCIHVLSQKDS